MNWLPIFYYICLAGRTSGILLSRQQRLHSGELAGLLWQKKCFYSIMPTREFWQMGK